MSCEGRSSRYWGHEPLRFRSGRSWECVAASLATALITLSWRNIGPAICAAASYCKHSLPPRTSYRLVVSTRAEYCPDNNRKPNHNAKMVNVKHHNLQETSASFSCASSTMRLLHTDMCTDTCVYTASSCSSSRRDRRRSPRSPLLVGHRDGSMSSAF